MSEMSRNARRAMRAKIHRLVTAKTGKVDASDYGPEEVLNADVKTGLRPISRRAYKKGGKVVAVSGADAKFNAGKKPRNGSKHLTVDALVNRNYKDANEAREGKKHIGGLKTGGRAEYAKGGSTWGDSTPLRLKGKAHVGPKGHSAKVYKDQDWGEYRVKHYSPEGKYMPDLDSFHDDLADANDSAKYAVEKGFKKGGRTKKEVGGGLKKLPTTPTEERDSPRPGEMDLLRKAAAEDAARVSVPPVGPKASTPTRPTPMPPRPNRKHGGKAWEGSAKDEAQDKKLAKKYGMSMKAWEKSEMDKKHDKQHSAKGLKRGGKLSMDGEYQGTRPTGGRLAKRDGGSLSGLEMNSGGRAKKSGKTNINIVIATGKGQQPMQPDMPMPSGGPQGIPVPMPASPAPAAAAAAPMPMPIPVPAAGGMGAGPAPMPRKAGGRTYRSYKDMDAGAGSGLGRLEKTEIQKHKR